MAHIRELDKTSDRRAIEALDTGFETDVIFELLTQHRNIELVERQLPLPITKRFLYVDRGFRRRGLGRALLERVEAYGRAAGASHVWLETSNVNVPGVRAYQQLGYSLCGADALYYGSYMPGESAIYLAKML